MHHFGANINIANILREQRLSHLASVYYNQIDPSHVSANFGLVLSQNQSSQQMRQILQFDPDNYIVMTQLAILRFLDHEDIKCMKLLIYALKINNSHLPAIINMAELLRFNG